MSEAACPLYHLPQRGEHGKKPSALHRPEHTLLSPCRVQADPVEPEPMGRQERFVLPKAVQKGERAQDRLRTLLRSVLGAIPPVEGVWGRDKRRANKVQEKSSS